MRFAEPQWLWGLAALPALGLVAWAAVAARRQALRRFAGGEEFVPRFDGEVSRHRRVVKALLTAAGLAALILALARPQWGERISEVTLRGSDVVVVVDSSLSMATEDLAPSRLVWARHAIDSLLEELGGERVGLLTFAGKADLICPLTTDLAAVRLFLDAVDVEAVPVGGTAMTRALAAALRALGGVESEYGDRARSIVLFTDGEDHEGELEAILPKLAEAGVAVFAIGTGTPEGGPIPERDDAGALVGYKKDREGKVVTSRVDEGLLDRVALETGGRYWRGTAGETEIDELAEALAALEAGDLDTRMRARYEERFQFPLAVGIACLLAEALLGDRRRREVAA